MFSFFTKKTDPKAELRKVLPDYTLPSFPTAVVQTLQKIRDPNSSASSIAEVLSVDPGLSVQVLRLAGSAAFSRRRKVENLSQAIALVGLSQLETMVLSIGVGRITPSRPSRGYDPARFWRASARRAVLANSFASLLCPARGSECFTAGFLQDMAVPFLATQHPESYGPILEQWHNEGGNLSELERSAFKWDHAEVATWICHEWQFPEHIAAAIGSHHDNRLGTHHVLVPVSLVAWIGETEKSLGVEGLIEDAYARCSIPPDKTHELVEASFEKAEGLARVLV